MTPLPDFPPAPVLTRRENEILSLIAAGYSNEEITRRLGIAISTVKNHTTSIYRKLDVRDRTNAAIYVWRSAFAKKTGDNNGTSNNIYRIVETEPEAAR